MDSSNPAPSFSTAQRASRKVVIEPGYLSRNEDVRIDALAASFPHRHLGSLREPRVGRDGKGPYESARSGVHPGRAPYLGSAFKEGGAAIDHELGDAFCALRELFRRTPSHDGR